MDTDDVDERSPFTRPGFIVSAIAVAAVAVLGIGAVTLGAGRDDVAAKPTSTPSSSQSPSSSSSASAEASVCGLGPVKLEGTVTSAPEAEWKYQGTTAYPTSEEYGPAAEQNQGVRYCFQHSPEGALFAAANAAVQGADPKLVEPWLDYFVAAGPHRSAVLASGGQSSAGTGARVEIAGFRLLDYTGSSARVDLGVRGLAAGRTVNLSMVYELVWQSGDWKLMVEDPKAPLNVASVPDLVGYVSWGAR